MTAPAEGVDQGVDLRRSLVQHDARAQVEQLPAPSFEGLRHRIGWTGEARVQAERGPGGDSATPVAAPASVSVRATSLVRLGTVSTPASVASGVG